MEITLKIDGKDKVFRQSKVTFKTMIKALDYQEALIEQMTALEQLANTEIDDDTLANYESDPHADAERAMELVVSYFDEQFSYDEFVNGAYFDDITQLYDLAREVMYEILTAKKEDADAKKTKRQQRK